MNAFCSHNRLYKDNTRSMSNGCIKKRKSIERILVWNQQVALKVVGFGKMFWNFKTTCIEGCWGAQPLLKFLLIRQS